MGKTKFMVDTIKLGWKGKFLLERKLYGWKEKRQWCSDHQFFYPWTDGVPHFSEAFSAGRIAAVSCLTYRYFTCSVRIHASAIGDSVVAASGSGEPYITLNARAWSLFYFYSDFACVSFFAYLCNDLGSAGSFGNYLALGTDSGDASVFAAPFYFFWSPFDFQLFAFSFVKGDGFVGDWGSGSCRYGSWSLIILRIFIAGVKQ